MTTAFLIIGYPTDISYKLSSDLDHFEQFDFLHSECRKRDRALRKINPTFRLSLIGEWGTGNDDVFFVLHRRSNMKMVGLECGSSGRRNATSLNPVPFEVTEDERKKLGFKIRSKQVHYLQIES